MDPSLAAVGRQGNKASEFTTDDGEERFRLGRARGQERARHAVPLRGNRKGGVRRSPSSLRINMLRHYKGKGSQEPRGIRKGRASWGMGGASVLYWRWDTY